MNDPKTPSHYLRFLAMISTSAFLMFGFSYLNSSQILAHARFSETRLLMTLMMASSMVWVMLGFMWSMYPSLGIKAMFLAVSLVMFGGCLWLVRSQRTVTDVDYMQAMIPHHSIAILTSENARIKDPRVRKLADGIIEAQRREIREMEALIDNLKGGQPE